MILHCTKFLETNHWIKVAAQNVESVSEVVLGMLFLWKIQKVSRNLMRHYVERAALVLIFAQAKPSPQKALKEK